MEDNFKMNCGEGEDDSYLTLLVYKKPNHESAGQSWADY